MGIAKEVSEFIFSIALFVNALLFIPQSVRILKEQSSTGVSLITFLGLLLIQVTIVLHGIITHDLVLVLGYFASILTTGLVVILVLIYRKRNRSSDELSLESIIAQLPGHVYWKDKNNIFVGSNTNNWKDFGFSSLREYIGKSDRDILSKNEVEQVIELDNKVLCDGKDVVAEESLTNADGSQSIYLSHKKALRNESGEIVGLLGCSVDITEAKQKTVDDWEMLENIIGMMPGHVYWMDKDGVYLGCNDNEARAIGLLSRKEIIGKRNTDIPGFVIPEAIDLVNAQVIGEGKTITAEEPALMEDGTEATYLSSKVPMKNRNGEITGLVGISIDITDRKKAEAAHEQAQGMRFLANVIAHEMRTPLRGMSAGASALEKFLPMLSETYEKAVVEKLTDARIPGGILKGLVDEARSIRNTAVSTNNFISTMITNLDFKKDVVKEQMLLSSCIDAVVTDYPFDQAEQNIIDTDVWDDFIVNVDKDLMLHILFNLIRNSLWHINSETGKIWITLKRNGKANQLIFKDNGSGISGDMVNKVFEYKVSGRSEGMGVGLTFCQWAMTRFGGHIDCSSEPGAFTQFTLNFPVVLDRRS